MRKWVALLTLTSLTSCASAAVVPVAVDTLCVSTTRYHATDGQVAAFKADQGLWEPLVNWLLAFNKVRDGACLKPVSG